MTRVLIVDDTASLRTAMRTALEASELGLEVVEASDGAEALPIALAGDVDIVVSDVQMPRLDGIALLRAIRRERDAVALPVILVTSQGEEAERQSSFEAGANDYLYRPFTTDELLDRLRVQLRLGALRDELESTDDSEGSD